MESGRVTITHSSYGHTHLSNLQAKKIATWCIDCEQYASTNMSGIASGVQLLLVGGGGTTTASGGGITTANGGGGTTTASGGGYNYC